MTDVLVRRPDEGTHREDSADDGGRDASGAAISQGTRRLAGKSKEARARQGRILPCRFQRKRGAAHTLISDFRSPEPRDNEYLLFHAALFVVLCNGSLGTLSWYLCSQM